MHSLVSYPERGNFGSNSYRGNTSGFIIIDLLNQFFPVNKCNGNTPKIILDINEGSGTTGDAVKHLNESRSEPHFKYYGYDLKNGHSFLDTDYVSLMDGQQSNLSFSHFPYHDMIKYSGSVWGQMQDDDTSHCKSINEFLEKSQVALMNQRESTSDHGFYTTLIGDMKRKGRCSSFQADFLSFMPRDELVNVVIKKQHNVKSNNTSYNANFIPIMHEYLLIWKKQPKSLVSIAYEKACQFREDMARTWRTYIRIVMIKLKEANLSDIYREVEAILPNSLFSTNNNIKAKIRQQLQMHHTNVSRGVWSI